MFSLCSVFASVLLAWVTVMGDTAAPFMSQVYNVINDALDEACVPTSLLQ